MKHPTRSLIITGASGILGQAIASAAHAKGFPIALVASNRDRLDALSNRLLQTAPENAKVTCHTADMSESKGAELLFEQIAQEHSQPFALVNAIGAKVFGQTAAEVNFETIELAMKQNFFAPINACKAFLRVMAQPTQDSSNCIINIGATASWRGFPRSSAFAASKAALRNFSQSMARELSPSGIHVAHLIIDGRMSADPQIDAQDKIAPHSVANSILNVLLQEKSAWTFEWDIRSHQEKW